MRTSGLLGTSDEDASRKGFCVGGRGRALGNLEPSATEEIPGHPPVGE